MRRYWNDAAGPEWVGLERDFDVALAPFADELIRRAAPAPGEHVLDVGCGFGTTTLALARAVGHDGRVMGLDISEPLLSRARERAQADGIRNVIWRQADAQEADLPPGHFDLVASRFGIMFFDDPGAAFRNLHRATKPAGRLAFVCWQPAACNTWYTFPTEAMAPYLPVPPPLPAGPGPFSFGDPDHVRQVLAAAGWGTVGVDAFDAEMVQGGGGDLDAVMHHLVRGAVATALRDAPLRATALDALRNAVAAHMGDGPAVWPAKAWMVTARR
jgi:SAM-dependent methyltransferase